MILGQLRIGARQAKNAPLVTAMLMVMVMVMVMVAVMIALLAEMRNIAQTLGASSVEEQLDFEARYEFVSTTSSKVEFKELIKKL